MYTFTLRITKYDSEFQPQPTGRSIEINWRLEEAGDDYAPVIVAAESSDGELRYSAGDDNHGDFTDYLRRYSDFRRMSDIESMLYDVDPSTGEFR